ncbi:MAG: hypothetical protein ABI430_04785 [Candidatus Taylorbacteria bacterium]
MQESNRKGGLAPIVVAIIVIVALLAGGGIYYAAKKGKPMGEVKSDTDVKTGTSENLQTGSLRSLISLGSSVKCTIGGEGTTGNLSGTVYISGSMMRGDFTMAGAQSSSDSHMINSGGQSYMWTGNQGIKMKAGETNSNGSPQSNDSIDLDQNVNYKCSDWIKDDSKFSPPTTVNFADFNEMMKNADTKKIPSGYGY